MTTIVAPGATFTPKQLQLEKKSGKLYWCDREGMRVMRANLDGSNIETLVDTSKGDTRPGPDARKWCVGIAVDAAGGKFYWTQKGDDNAGQGRIFRANIELPRGWTPANRQDIELFYDNLPEPIDLDLDVAHRVMYWTDRGDPPRSNTVNRAPMDSAPGARKGPEILFSHLMEGIGLALDLKGGRMFFTDLAGSVYSANLDGSNKKTLLFAEGNLTGIAYVEIWASHLIQTGELTMTTKPIRRVAVIQGSGLCVIVARSWTALFLANGLEVVATGNRAECGSCPEALRRSGLAGAQETGPWPRGIPIQTDIRVRPCDSGQGCRPCPGERARADRIQEEAVWTASTSCCRPT